MSLDSISIPPIARRVVRFWTEDSTLYDEFAVTSAPIIDALQLVLLLGAIAGAPTGLARLVGGDLSGIGAWITIAAGVGATWLVVGTLLHGIVWFFFRSHASRRVVLTALGYASSPFLLVIPLAFQPILGFFALALAGLGGLIGVHLAFSRVLRMSGAATLTATALVPAILWIRWVLLQFTAGPTLGTATILWGPAAIERPPCAGDVTPGGECIPPDLVPIVLQPPRWDTVPEITIYAEQDDPRLPATLDAIAFWNGELAQLGTPFHLGDVQQRTQLLPESYLLALYNGAIHRGHVPDEPPSIADTPGTLVIAMSQADFNPFSAFPHPGRPVVTVITRYKGTLDQPDLARNVIAHELGHAIGLKHNADPTTLMCGWPNWCSGNFELFSSRSFIGPTSSERSYLMSLYPSSWTPK